MRPPLLALALFLLSAPARAQNEGLAKVRHEGQKRVLQEKGLDAPPDLRRWGLVLDADGVYRAVAAPPGAPPGTARKTATADNLKAVLERWSSTGGGPSLPAAPRAVPGEQAVQRHAERERAVTATMNADAQALTVQQRFDSSFAPGGTSSIPPDRKEALRRGLLRAGYERLSQGAVTPPELGTPSAWAGLSDREVDARLEALRRAGDPEIRAVRAELVRLAAAGTGDRRGRAIELLSRLHDETLLPVLLTAAVDRRDSHARWLAGEGLASIALSYKSSEGGWDAFIDKAPPILNVLLKASPEWSFGFSADLGPLYAITDLLNLMEPAQKKRFLAGFGDPRVMLMILSLGDTARIGRATGVHSDTAALVYARYRELVDGGAPGLGAFMSDPAVDGDAKAGLLGRLSRYKYAAAELERDESFRRVLPSLLFGPQSRVPPGTVFSLAVLAAGLPKAEFARHSMAFIKASAAKDVRPALTFFLLHPQMLDARQRAELDAKVDALDPALRASFDAYRRTPSLYGYWPRSGPLEAALVITQDGHARMFGEQLVRLGYRPLPAQGGAQRFENGRVRLSVWRFASDADGWARDKDAVGRALGDRLLDPRYQVVVYRGHVGDYASPLMNRDGARGKAFIDLSCDSAGKADEVMARCEDCAFFGTNTTAEGAINNAFLPEALAGLAARESFSDMNRRFQLKMPKLFHRYTGSWSAARLWEAASRR